MQKAGRILVALESAGHEAYIVGGAVRDAVLGLPSDDIDIATNARPEQIQAVAGQNGWPTVAVGAAFGVVVIVVDGTPYEVATYRTERYGQDSHRPEEVAFAVSLDADLARRDFTMNALAMDSNGKLVDPFGGCRDIAAGVVRTVGDPDVRFAEDGLRMFRAVRFAAKLGFSLDSAIPAAIARNLPRIRGLSAERVVAEIEKTLVARYAGTGLDLMLTTGLAQETCRRKEGKTVIPTAILPELADLRGVGQNPRFHRYDVWRHTAATVDAVRPDLTLRWAALLHDIGKGRPGVRVLNRYGQPSDYGHEKAGANLAAVILDRLKVQPKITKKVAWLIYNHMRLPQPEPRAAVRWLRKLAQDFHRPEELAEALDQLLELHRADRLAGHIEPELAELKETAGLIRSVLAKVPFYPCQLALSGGEIAAGLGAGRQVADFQKDLISRIQSGLLDNSREALQKALAARRKRINPPG